MDNVRLHIPLPHRALPCGQRADACALPLARSVPVRPGRSRPLQATYARRVGRVVAERLVRFLQEADEPLRLAQPVGQRVVVHVVVVEVVVELLRLRVSVAMSWFPVCLRRYWA